MLVLLFISFFAHAQTHDQIRTSIEQIIGERHPTDRKETWFALGTEAPSVIIEMLEGGADAYQRIRLLEALGYFQSSTVSEYLRREAKVAKNPQYRISSLKGLIKSEGEGAIDFAKDYLEDADLNVRKSVLSSIRKLGTIRADQLVREYESTHPKAEIYPTGSLKPTGTNESKPELALLGEWSGYSLVFDPKKKQIIPKKVSVQFDFGLGDKLILRTKREGQKNYTEANIEKEKWKWSSPDQPEVLELVSGTLKIRFFVTRSTEVR